MSNKCKYCHQVGFHKLSCPTKKVTAFLEPKLNNCGSIINNLKLKNISYEKEETI